MEAKFEEERRCRMEIEAKLEQERKLREGQSVMLQNMVTWMQGLGASMNYATPPPPFALPAQPYFPAGPSDTPVSMLCLKILIIISLLFLLNLCVSICRISRGTHRTTLLRTRTRRRPRGNLGPTNLSSECLVVLVYWTYYTYRTIVMYWTCDICDGLCYLYRCHSHHCQSYVIDYNCL